jgi:hypothetical protein
MPSAEEMDRELHSARFDRVTGKVTYKACLDSLPDGCFVQLDSANYLLWAGHMYLWSQGGYVSKHPKPGSLTVTTLTPEPLVRCIREGYRPVVHPTLLAL